MQPYDSATEQTMQQFYQTLSEKDKRRYAAIEAVKLGHGGQRYISRLFDCSRKTISRGICELQALSPDNPGPERIRRPGGGRKGYEEKKH